MGIRERLTLCFASLFSVLVIGLAVTVYWIARTQVYAKLDSALDVATAATAMAARHELDEHSEKDRGELDIQRVLDEAGDATELRRTEIIVEENGRVTAYKAGDFDRDLRSIRLDSRSSPRTVDGFRIATRLLTSEKHNTAYRIMAARPIASIQSQIDTLRNGLLLVVPLGILCASLIGNWVAGRALIPLRDLAQTLSRMNSSDLTLRVNVLNPGDAIGQLALCFNGLMSRLEQAFTLQRRFMADASHQIRTPVTIALAAAQVTHRDPDTSDADVRHALAIVEGQMLQLRRIVDDMFFLSQADTTPQNIELLEIHLDDAVAEAARAAATLARKKHQTLRWTGLSDAYCRGDFDLLTQAVLILLDNAVKFTPDGGTISVDISRRDGDWICSVVDNGIGIPEADQPRIFERFFRVNRQDAAPQKGAGLGLSIARWIAESHNGRVTLVESRPGYTNFELAIPVLERTDSAHPAHANSSTVKI